MLVKLKPVKIGEGVSFTQAERIYTHYVKHILGNKHYTTIKPLFIKMGRKEYGLFETVSQVSIVVPNSRFEHKRGWCDSINIHEKM